MIVRRIAMALCVTQLLLVIVALQESGEPRGLGQTFVILLAFVVPVFCLYALGLDEDRPPEQRRQIDRRPVAAALTWIGVVALWRLAFGDSDDNARAIYLAIGVPLVAWCGARLWRWATR
jgi:hypothetical protein